MATRPIGTFYENNIEITKINDQKLSDNRFRTSFINNKMKIRENE